MSVPTHIKTATPPARATDWYARLRAEDVTPGELDAFKAWLDADPEHAREFEALDALWGGMTALETAPEIAAARSDAGRLQADAQSRAELPVESPAELPAESPIETPVAKRAVTNRWQGLPAFVPTGVSNRALGVAAAILLMVGVTAATLWLNAGVPDQFTTRLGEQRVLTFDDGSTVTLDTLTELTLHYSETERRVVLVDGQADFRVARDTARPFIVTAGDAEVWALGTSFNVFKTAAGVTVTLIEGKVEVRPLVAAALPASQTAAPGEPLPAVEPTAPRVAQLSTGEQISYRQNALTPVTKADVARISAWRDGKLDFFDTPLSEAVAQMNRYSRVQIVLADDELGALRFSGIFETRRTDAFVGALEAYFGIRSVRTAGNRVMLVAGNRD